MAVSSDGSVADPLARPVAKRTAHHVLHEQPVKRRKSGGTVLVTESREVTIDEDQDTSAGHDTLIAQDVQVFDEDEDDRFFGGGLTTEQADALDYLDANDKEDYGPAVSLDLSGLRKLAARFEKAITKNQKMRARYADEPTRFLESEVDLDQEIKNLNVLSEYPELLKDFVGMGCLESLISLFGHENSDIACSAIQVLDEITDEDTNASEEQVTALTAALKSTSAVESLVQTLARLDEAELVEREAVFKSMSILENIINMDNTFKEFMFDQTKLQDWLLQRISRPDEVGFPMSDNRQYAAELLSIITQDSVANTDLLIQADSIDRVLLLLAPYRKKDPDKGSTEEEFFENLFDILDTLVTRREGKDRFIEGEGVELMQRLLLDARASETRLRALKTLEYACGSWDGGAVCQNMVEVGLLRSLFSVFMKKDDTDVLKTCLGIFVSFFRTLNDGEAERIRVINKFVENKFAKTSRLLNLRKVHKDKHDRFVENMRDSGQSLAGYSEGEIQFTRYLDRLDNGLDILQLIDTLLAWLAASDTSIVTFMQSSGKFDFASVRTVLQELIDSLRKDASDSTEEATAEPHEISDAEQEREMLQAIMEAVPKT
ncbi:Putative uncharacterized protein [Taphrina deformans PYCC 5710]|uniref:Beta-catenin-like protein 1 N-terminal domain-containing protein n=1 Tax=Taphrina deformans (strain PYCC 5710 / ATCC 11124 / CBS 356.35 / IMI 108563 / JCM 9778 / NBRC 8474) TaxID=1097556 RepID=R4XF16_TAPDE|nr:Putative uncharacterized protein [Taphrina deformans PYCC 5710]|eukprot:CCG83061.1 Putative uncharacterized protein [Taphrina deformans PYCC 5710]